MAEGPPRHRRALEQRLRNISDDEIDFLDKRRQLANVAVISALASRLDDRGEPVFAVKGGVSLELEFGHLARPTRDLDLSYRAERRTMADLLRDALAEGWQGFEFRMASDLKPIAETGAEWCDVKVSYRGDALQTVRVELGAAEGVAGLATRRIEVATLSPEAVGLGSVGALPLVSAQYSIAQKLHACTDHSHPAMPNDRARDLIDIIQLWRSLDAADRAATRAACKEIFAARGKHPWPPTVLVPGNWRSEYSSRAEELEFEPADVDAAAAEVQGIIREIGVS